MDVIEQRLDNISNTKREKIQGITLHSYAEWYDNTARYGGYSEVEKKNGLKEDYGFTYLIDQYEIVEAVKPDILVDPFIDKKTTYIATKLYDDLIAKNTISVCVFFMKEHNYEETEKHLIIFLSELLNKYNLKTEDIWRGYDLSKEDKGPIPYLDKEVFKKLLDEIQEYMDSEDKDNFEFKPVIDIPEEKTYNEVIEELFNKAQEDIDSFISQYEPDAKGIQELLTQTESEKVNMTTKTYPTKNTLQYSVNNVSPGVASHCVRAFDKMNGIASNAKTMVEPIYPDLITPPGGDINIADGQSETAINSKSNISMSIEDFKNRQKTFNLNDYSNISKTTVGRPINTDDPYPVDEQIKKLEEHFPKVKIDKITYDFTDSNHPGDGVGAAAIKNFNMLYDIVDEISKRTEKRLVKLENNLSTIMRNLFRLSSRISINCQYYGGQSVYGRGRF